MYCAIGQRASAVARAVAVLRDKGAMEHTVVVVTEGNDPPGLAYVAPFAATSIAEHFMEAGRDVLIVYDDLIQHARAFRELSLLHRRPPGREAFPGDIFHIHSRLLERATHLCAERVGGSLTALLHSQAHQGGNEVSQLHLFYNRSSGSAAYAPVSPRLLPLDEHWRRPLAELPWPTRNPPELVAGGAASLRALIGEYLFVSLFRACAESLASENAGRRAAMERADRNIGELLETQQGNYQRLRQSGIDEELFDVISGFEAMSSLT